MSLARHAKRRDGNERAIVQALERAGAQVWRIDRPGDLLVWTYRCWYVMEVKSARGRLSRSQSEDREGGLCEGVLTVRTPLQALRAVQGLGTLGLGDG